MPFSADQTEEPTPAQAETITPTLYVWEKCAKKKPIPSSNTFCVKIWKKVCYYLPIGKVIYTGAFAVSISQTSSDLFLSSSSFKNLNIKHNFASVCAVAHYYYY